MTDRFGRARSHLLNKEKRAESRRAQSRKLGKRLPEETIRIPKIGEWALAPGTPTIDEAIATPKSRAKFIKPFPENVQLTAEQKARREKALREGKHVTLPPDPNPYEKAPYHVKAPRMISDTQVVTEMSRCQYPQGTVTTDLNSIIRSRYRAPSSPLPPLQGRGGGDGPPLLPLEVFDDTTYAEYSLEELLKRPEAFSKFVSVNGDVVWQPCKVIGQPGERAV